MSKKYNAEEKILMALYAEYLSDDPNYIRVNEVTLCMKPETFLWGLMKLQRSGKVTGVSWIPDYAEVPAQVSVVTRDWMALTEKGAEQAREITETGKKRAEEALKVIAEIFRDLGIAAFSGLIIHG